MITIIIIIYYLFIFQQYKKTERDIKILRTTFFFLNIIYLLFIAFN